jgi:hypothetical protein
MQLRLAERAEDFFGSGNTHRAVSAGLVLLLHLLILAALLYSRVKTHGVSEPRETILALLPLLKHELPVHNNPGTTPKTKRQVMPVRTSPYPNITPPIQAVPDATVLGPALNGCSLETMDKLSPEQRAKCIAYQNDVVGAARNAKDHDGLNKASRAVAAADWAQAIVKRNTPAKVDCTSIETPQYGIQENMKTTRLMVDLTCAARHLAAGKSPLN